MAPITYYILSSLPARLICLPKSDHLIVDAPNTNFWDNSLDELTPAQRLRVAEHRLAQSDTRDRREHKLTMKTLEAHCRSEPLVPGQPPSQRGCFLNGTDKDDELHSDGRNKLCGCGCGRSVRDRLAAAAAAAAAVTAAWCREQSESERRERLLRNVSPRERVDVRFEGLAGNTAPRRRIDVRDEGHIGHTVPRERADVRNEAHLRNTGPQERGGVRNEAHLGNAGPQKRVDGQMDDIDNAETDDDPPPAYSVLPPAVAPQ